MNTRAASRKAVVSRALSGSLGSTAPVTLTALHPFGPDHALDHDLVVLVAGQFPGVVGEGSSAGAPHPGDDLLLLHIGQRFLTSAMLPPPPVRSGPQPPVIRRGQRLRRHHAELIQDRRHVPEALRPHLLELAVDRDLGLGGDLGVGRSVVRVHEDFETPQTPMLVLEQRLGLLLDVAQTHHVLVRAVGDKGHRELRGSTAPGSSS